MKAVFSFWSKPFRAKLSTVWASEAHHLFSWALALDCARKHYPKTALVTDRAGARLLVDDLGLCFTEVSTALDDLDDLDPGWWAIGKMAAYGLQKEPFVHVDGDVYLWKPLPERLTAAPVFAQNPDDVALERSVYRPGEIRAAFAPIEGAWLPEEWRSYETLGGRRIAECGIVGGTRVDFFAHYGAEALRWLRAPENRDALAGLRNKGLHMIALEQWFLTACVAHHAGREGSPFRDVAISYLFDSAQDAWTPRRASELGYTHLLGTAKRNAKNAAKLEARVRRDLPALYEACVRVAAKRQGDDAPIARGVVVSPIAEEVAPPVTAPIEPAIEPSPPTQRTGSPAMPEVAPKPEPKPAPRPKPKSRGPNEKDAAARPPEEKPVALKAERIIVVGKPDR